MLQNSLGGYAAIHLAAEKGLAGVVSTLADRGGADVNARSAGPEGLTPLAIAARAGRLAVVEMLLAKGANVDLPCLVSHSQYIQHGHRRLYDNYAWRRPPLCFTGDFHRLLLDMDGFGIDT